MANQNKPHLPHVIEFIQSLPAWVLAREPRPSGRYWSTSIDCGPKSYVSDAVPMCGGATREAACEDVKRWLLDDLQCLGQIGKRRYQPHWCQYDLLYRLGDYWKAKLAAHEQAHAA